MGTDALLSAILSGVLRPSAQPLDFGRAPVTVEDIEEVMCGSIFQPLARRHVLFPEGSNYIRATFGSAEQDHQPAYRSVDCFFEIKHALPICKKYASVPGVMSLETWVSIFRPGWKSLQTKKF